jgi:hypothetical protein
MVTMLFGTKPFTTLFTVMSSSRGINAFAWGYL